MLDRKSAVITFDPHVFTRQLERHFDIDFAEETIRTGDIDDEKSNPPHKLCFHKYHGKERVTYVIVALFHADFIEVKTIWLKPGN